MVAAVLAFMTTPGQAESELDSMLGAPVQGADLEATATGTGGTLSGLGRVLPEQRELMENSGRMPIGNPTGSRPAADMNADIGLAPMVDFLTPNITIRGGAF